jgi:rfaE bifunctional protein nucleotidyltransferase chain/domain
MRYLWLHPHTGHYDRPRSHGENDLDPSNPISHAANGIIRATMTVNQDKKPMRLPANAFWAGRSSPAKVLTLAQAARWAAAARRRGQRIVATNGCFDLLHYGHVNYLQRARKLGDLLVVGLNSDASVRQLKGHGRPLVRQQHRAAVLAALACVDAVAIFNDRRADRFLAAVRPDIYVKAGDYTAKTLDAGERAVLKRLGAQIRIVPFVPGFSTTGLIAKIRKSGL